MRKPPSIICLVISEERRDFMSQIKEVLRQIIIAAVLYFLYRGPLGPFVKGNSLWILPLAIISLFWGMQLEKIINPKRKKDKVPFWIVPTLFFWLLFRASLEEFMFRVFLWGILERYIGIWWALIATNIIFSLLHAHQGWRGMVGSFFHGVVWGLIFYSMGIAPAIFSHLAFNLGGYIRNVRIKTRGQKK